MDSERRISAEMIQGNSLAKDKQSQDLKTETQGFKNKKSERKQRRGLKRSFGD